MTAAVSNWEAAVLVGQEVRALLPEADVLPDMPRCGSEFYAYNTIRSTDLQALVRLIKIKEDDLVQLRQEIDHATQWWQRRLQAVAS
jgi:hypothetical protein